uniref:BTB domain-containing protein n=1 Tax=Spongospora subterranea TaxID=70186 RepID=A0A0H5R971_9EUKA|eukprot:CRZ10257.1 hypothetical protein [Spongospora subterranea]
MNDGEAKMKWVSGSDNAIETSTNRSDAEYALDSLKNDLKRMFDSKMMSDFEIIVGDTHFQTHRVILCARVPYFKRLFCGEMLWEEGESGIVFKPNTTAKAMSVVLNYLYTDDITEQDPGNLIDTFSLAHELELSSISVQITQLLVGQIRVVFQGIVLRDCSMRCQRKRHISSLCNTISQCICPGLIAADRHQESSLWNDIIDVLFENIDLILYFTETYNCLIDNTPPWLMGKLISHESLNLEENDAFQLTLQYSCRRAGFACQVLHDELIAKYLHGNPIDGANCNDQDQAVADNLMHLLSSIRFTLMSPEEFAQEIPILSAFQPRQKMVQLCQYFIGGSHAFREQPRNRRIIESILIDRVSEKLLNKLIMNVMQTGRVEFQPLYRASRDGFDAASFHKTCDGVGPTLVIVKSQSGCLFGGFNENSWSSTAETLPGEKNFLFRIVRLPRCKEKKLTSTLTHYPVADNLFASVSNADCGPIFGKGRDLCIADLSNQNAKSYNRPCSYPGAVGLAGSSVHFKVSDYEVFLVEECQ